MDDKCRHQGTTLLPAGVHAQPLFALINIGLDQIIGTENLFENIDDALNRARSLLGISSVESPSGTEPEVARERTRVHPGA